MQKLKQKRFIKHGPFELRNFFSVLTILKAELCILEHVVLHILQFFFYNHLITSMRASANREVGFGKVMKIYLKVSDRQTQMIWLLPSWTELHTC